MRLSPREQATSHAEAVFCRVEGSTRPRSVQAEAHSDRKGWLVVAMVSICGSVLRRQEEVNRIVPIGSVPTHD